MYTCTSLYAREKDRKIITYIEFVYKRPRMTMNYRIVSFRKDNFQLHIREIVGKKTAFNEVCLN